ncbi:MAG: DUF1848 domain-containing protein [Vallitaleaceae bacterium]|nr:DUF1848 domain-containing protein [Vallitaleaceae bacterium]
MIISVSRRTDIPTWYADWFFNRLRDGHVLVRNPMNYHQVSSVRLTKDVVDCFVFWTKNPSNILPRLSELSGYNYYFQVTINDYKNMIHKGSFEYEKIESHAPEIEKQVLDIEKHVPDVEKVIASFIALSKTIGRHKIIWRYDPIIITSKLTVASHLKNFEMIAKKLAGYTKKCVISFVDDYAKTDKQMKAIGALPISSEMMLQIGVGLSRIGRTYDMTILTCAEAIDLSPVGIDHSRCIDDQLISEIIGQPLSVEKDKNQRAYCGCVSSIDIGAYNTCGNGCIYCYANHNEGLVAANMKKHDPDSPLLIGQVAADDVIKERLMVSYIDRQLRLY